MGIDTEAAAKEKEKVLNNDHLLEKNKLSAEANKFENQLRICEVKVNSLNDIIKENKSETDEMRKRLKAVDKETANSQQKIKEKAAEDMAKKAAESKKQIEDLKSQVKKLEDVVKNRESKLSDSAKQIKAEKDRHKTLAQARIAVSKELTKALKDKSDLEETLKAKVEELDKVRIIQVGLGCKQSQVNLPKLSEKDLDKDDLQLLKSPTVTVLEEANKDLTEKLTALENKLIAEVELRESLENEMKGDKSRMEFTGNSKETLLEEVALHKSSILSLEKEKNELLEIKDKYESLEKSLHDEIELRKSLGLELESTKQENLNLEKQVKEQSEKFHALDEEKNKIEITYKQIIKGNEAIAEKTKIERNDLEEKYRCLEKENVTSTELLTQEIDGLQSKLP